MIFYINLTFCETDGFFYSWIKQRARKYGVNWDGFTRFFLFCPLFFFVDSFSFFF